MRRLGARILVLAAASLALLAGLGGAAQAAAPAPAWNVASLAAPTHFKPGDSEHDYYYQLEFTNIGGSVTDGSPITVADTLPAGLAVEDVELLLRDSKAGVGDFAASACTTEVVAETATVTCTVTEAIAGALEPARLFPGEQLKLKVSVSVPPGASGALLNRAEVSGGGAAAAFGELENRASDEEAPPGFAEFGASVLGADGEPVSQAASHPYQYVTTFAVNTVFAANGTRVISAGGVLKNIEVALPPGLIGNPTATATRCPAKQFSTVRSVSEGGTNIFLNECPPSSAVGLIAMRQIEGFTGGIGALYNLVPPKGMPAQLGFAPVGAPIYIDTELRSGDYGVSARIRNSSAAKRVTAATVILWGTPDDPSHDPMRGECSELGGVCALEESGETPFLRLPTSCAAALPFTMRFDTWESPGAFSTASSTSPAPEGCAQPPFEPSLELRPSTAVADSPSGLDVRLHLPQGQDPEALASADLRDARVVLPPGLLVNPSSADGLAACSPRQIGLLSAAGEAPPRFDGEPPRCPGAAKIGTVEVRTPLLEHPLPGAVYLAEPFENPFDSLIAIYIAVDDPQSGVVVKLAGHVRPDPRTGRLTTTVKSNPQTPFEDFALEFFEGARAPLRTPATCGEHTTRAELVPHSAPAGPTARPSDSFATRSGALGGRCPRSEAGLPHAPAFAAGTAAPLAAAYSPFLLRLARQDGSQEIDGLRVDLPPGLLGNLSGLSPCPEASLAAAAAKDGEQERKRPSCPPASRVGAVTVAAGAGPAPYHVRGAAYLAGPYKGAPLSLAVLTPATAGPFDLGTVVVRAALFLDPESARIAAVSDPLPSILAGIRLDVRSIALRADRPGFTLNPTSCAPMAIGGQAISTLERVAPLASRFQVGECARLGFKPKLAMRLRGATRRGGHPALRAVLKMPPGGANIARAAVALPRSAFLDQANIRTICTRVQFAAGACPEGSVYGRARAWTPLLDEPLTGPVILRSSDNDLPDLVAVLRGPTDLPVEVHAVGRIDSARGGIRTTFETVPDAPVSRFALAMQGGKRKGLLVNSRDVCAHRYRARANLKAHNGRRERLRPALVNPKCKKRRRAAKPGKGKHRRRGGARGSRGR